MRLDRFLSSSTSLSRAEAQRAIRSGRVVVDGLAVRDPGFHVQSTSRVEMGGQSVTERGPRYFMLHKPTGYVCATRDDEHPTALELLKGEGKEGLHFAGRLDIDATGLVLITDDGDWSHRVSSPRRKCAKTYRVTLAEALTDSAVEVLAAGVLLKGEKRPTSPTVVEPLAARECRLTITEGKYHQVKRMFAAVGNRVIALHRERIGGVVLDPDLAPGQWRPLSAGEIAAAACE